MPLHHERLSLSGREVDCHSVNTLVIGSGAAALNAALQLVRRGVGVAIVTERWGGGTSFNAGSDKQTYYKLALAGGADDSPRRMAEDLFAGEAMHGDIALCEAQHSAQAFFNLVSLGVPFPHDRHGGYLGYRTDNDTRGRASSAGPETSRIMCERLGRAVREAGVPIFDGHQVVALVCPDEETGRRARGAVALDRSRRDASAPRLVLFNVTNVILAVGGPGALFRDTVYPPGQIGSNGLGLRAGAVAQNLTEFQFGLASVGFRWNLSGSYQQVIPRYVSTDADGGDEREFLADGFDDMRALASAVFRKGYEWPFDVQRIASGGSSMIDLLVHREIDERSRRVWLDYRREADGGGRLEPFTPGHLDAEARDYLERSGAIRSTPIERLRAMNPEALALYARHGIDLERQRLEIAVCAQHLNGGLRGSIWWETSVPHLFAVGEAAGTHGVRRPGGAALNAGQVGALRAALYIAHRYRQEPLETNVFAGRARTVIDEIGERMARWLENGRRGRGLLPGEVIRAVGARMSGCAAHVREVARLDPETRAAWALHERVTDELRVSNGAALGPAFHALDLTLTHAVTLQAIVGYLRRGGGSRGSALVIDSGGVGDLQAPGGSNRCGDGSGISGCARASADPRFMARHIQEIWLDDELRPQEAWVTVRPIPETGGWFENVWADFVSDRIVR